VKHLLALALATAFVSTTAYAGERVGDFALIDHQGAIQHMAWYSDHSAVVIMPMANSQSAVASLDVASLKTLQEKYAEQGVQFFLLNPGLRKDRAQIQSDVAAMGLNLPVLMDDAQLVTEMLGLSRIDQAALYDPSNFELLYRGPIADIESSLQKLLAGEKFKMLSVASSGSKIKFSNLDAHKNLSYEKDIAPIIVENCASCHRDGGIAPFAMDSSIAVQGWSAMIREVVMTKRMPPGQIDNKVGHKMKNEMNLSDEEMQKLIRWINTGAKVDGEHDPLTSLTWPSSKWSLGEPDLIVKVPEQSIPATGVVDYINIPVDLGLDRDVWIKGSEIVAGDPSVLHHIITTAIPPEGAPNLQQILIELLSSLPADEAQSIRAKLFATLASGKKPNIGEIFNELPDIDIGAFLGGDSGFIAGYAPGNNVSLNPPGVGGLLKAGTTLNLQMHYTTSGKKTTDSTEIGIYFYDQGEAPKEHMSSGVGNAFAIKIPAQVKDHEMKIVTLVSEDAELYSLMPHMHFRGKRMRFNAQYPDGSEELILSVPAYSFNWQLAHELKEPLAIPAGTKIVATGAFDNSSQNTFNPDPNAEINWGEQSWKEMFMGFYTWKNVEQGVNIPLLATP
tara:strand:+ start:22613 stop:24466 length:1854 start_codon:yes stop_codon:yes gene_type:complete